MKKYRVKLKDDRIVGPLSESDIKSLLESKKINKQSNVQYFPNGEWKELESYSELIETEATFIRKLDEIGKSDEPQPVEKNEDPPKDFPKEFNFEKDKENEEETKPHENSDPDKTVVRKIPESIDDDKTQINPDTLKYLEELKSQKEEEAKEVEQEKEPEEEQVDLKNDSTQMINLNDLKNELADEVVETELSLEREKLSEKKNEAQLRRDNKLKSEEPKKEEPKKKNKKVLYLAIILIAAFFLFDDPEEVKVVKKISVINPVINFPRQFEVENPTQAKKFFQEGITLLKKPTYINKVKAGVKFRISTEHKFRDNSAMAYLIRVYSELLENSNTKIEDSSKIFKLVQIHKSKALSDPKFAEAVASFYLYAGKPYAAQKTIEKFNSITTNKPTTELFALYLDILRINSDISKANNVLERLEKIAKPSFRIKMAIMDYLNFLGRSEEYKRILTQTYKEHKYSVGLLIKSIKILIDEQRFDIVPKLLYKVKERVAENSKIYYSKYLEYKGIYQVFKKKYKLANGYFEKALKFNESSELRSRLASLDLSGDPIADVLISESKAIELIERSKDHLKKNNMKAAFQDALEATSIAENYIPAKLNLAQLQIKNGLFKEAISSLEGLQKKNITDPEVTFTLIDAYTESYKFNDVKKLLSIISTSNLVDDYRYYTATAKYYVYKDDFYNSVNWLQLAIRKNPLDEDMHFELAKILIQYRKYQKAKVFLSKLIDINPVDLKYRVAYSGILYETEGITYAVGYLYDILRDYPNNSEILSAIGIYYYKSGQQKKYNSIKKELSKLPKRDPSIYKFLIESSKLDNDDKVLVENAIELLKIQPGNLPIRILLGKTYLKNEKFEKALEQFKKVEDRLETYPRLQYFMSKLYLLTDNNEKAISLAKKEVETNPQNIEGYVLLGDIYRKEKKYLDAEDMYKKAQKINDKDVDTLIGLSSINLKKSQFDIAIDLLKKARQVNPNNPDTHKLLGDAYRKIGQSSLASESYKIFLELSPNSRYKDEIDTYIRIMQ